MLCKCINVNLRDIKVKQKFRIQSIHQVDSNSWKICLALSENSDPTKVYRFETNIFIAVWSHLPWSDHDQELLIVDPAVLVLIRHREHLQYLLGKGKVTISLSTLLFKLLF